MRQAKVIFSDIAVGKSIIFQIALRSGAKSIKGCSFPSLFPGTLYAFFRVVIAEPDLIAGSKT